MAALREALEGDDTTPSRPRPESLSQAAMKLGEAMYKAQQEEAAAGEGTDMPGGRRGGAGHGLGTAAARTTMPTVVDADFEEVDDERKDKSA